VATVYSKLFAAQTVSTVGATSLYTVPAGATAILRDCVVQAGTSGAITIDVFDVTNGLAIARFTSAAANDVFQWQGRQVFPATTEIGVYVVSGGWLIRFSGYLLDG
jgi:hypothetical protein